MDKIKLNREDLVYPELSYKIVGILFDVYNSVGYGQDERTYQRAVATALNDVGLKFKEQVYFPLSYSGKKIGSGYLDFLVEDKIVLEIKKGDRFVKSHIDQVYRYLTGNNLRLGLLAYFAPRNVHFKRILNI
ncbi:MAG: GxxExxY protein [Parcubacteria group bacterium]|nr:GxxExxY protein [Parcubacteria group bacterium]